MPLERWWFWIRLSPWRVAKRENHNWNIMHPCSGAAHDNPGDDEEREKDESDEKIITVFLNRLIQELGHTRDMENRVNHISLSDFNILLTV
jgi:hypothetical protein